LDRRLTKAAEIWSNAEIINSSLIVLTTLLVFLIMISAFDQISAALVSLLSKLGG
jgi:preprotein translocase subunit SecE